MCVIYHTKSSTVYLHFVSLLIALFALRDLYVVENDLQKWYTRIVLVTYGEHVKVIFSVINVTHNQKMLDMEGVGGSFELIKIIIQEDGKQN